MNFISYLGKEKDISESLYPGLECQYNGFDKYSSEDIDQISVEILTMTDPNILESLLPLKTIGDGNCLFRAASIAAYNDESRHTELRHRVFLEIRDNPNWYDKDDQNYCSPFANDPEVKLANYAYYFINTPKDREWADLNHLLALSAVLETPIMSYFPSISSTTHSFTKLIIGRNVLFTDAEVREITIMWTSMSLPEKFEDFAPNHFVPLIPRKFHRETKTK